MLDKNLDIFLISETKLDDLFPPVQFKIGFTTPYRYDRKVKGGGLLLYIREDIPSGLLQCKSQCSIGILSGETINLRKRKWFLKCLCNPHRNSVSRHLKCLTASLLNTAKPIYKIIKKISM